MNAPDPGLDAPGRRIITSVADPADRQDDHADGGDGPPDGPGGGPVLAAGCVLWRRGASGAGIEIALVHRPKYDDWSHPKGKLEREESALSGALREVAEETGMSCRPGPSLPTTHYLAKGRLKQVSYWAAEALPDEQFVPNHEVDRLVWLPPAAARLRLTHDRDRPLVDALVDVLGRA